MSRRYLLRCVPSESQSPGGALDATAKRSVDGRVLQIQVVNRDLRPIAAELRLDGFDPMAAADVLTLSGAPGDTHMLDRPDRVAPVASRWQGSFASGKAVYTFRPYSSTILRWTRGAATAGDR